MAISNVAKEQTIMKTQTNTNTNTLRSRYVAVTEHGDVKLADAHNGKFKRFKKMIAGYGDFVDPRNAGRKMVLDREFSHENRLSLQEEKAARKTLANLSK